MQTEKVTSLENTKCCKAKVLQAIKTKYLQVYVKVIVNQGIKLLQYI